MKNISSLLIVLFCLGLSLNAQESTDTTSYTSSTKKQDTTRISWGKKKIIIISDDINISISDKDSTKKQRYNHFTGLDLGINGFLTEDNSIDLQKEGQFMDLNYRKSISVGFGFKEWYMPIAKEKLGLATAIGIEFNTYTLDRDVTIFSNKDTTVGIADATKSIEKNKFKSTMLNVPLVLETNIGKDAAHSFYLAVGGQFSYRIGSKTKQIYEQDDTERKVKDRTDFNMNDFRFNAIARVGYGHFTLYGAYSLTPMFDKDSGPELYPFTVGIAFQ